MMTVEEFKALLSHVSSCGTFSRQENDADGIRVTRTYSIYRFDDELGLCVRTSPFDTVAVFKLKLTPARPSFMGVIPATTEVICVYNKVVDEDSDADDTMDGSDNDDAPPAKSARRRLGTH